MKYIVQVKYFDSESDAVFKRLSMTDMENAANENRFSN